MRKEDLRNEIQKQIDNGIKNSSKLSSYAKKIRNGNGTYKDLYDYSSAMSAYVKSGISVTLAKYVGDEMNAVFLKEIDGMLGSEILKPLFENYHGSLINLSASKMQQDLKALSLGIKPIKTDATYTRLYDLLKPFDDATELKQVFDYLEGERIEQFYNASLDEFIQENAAFQYEAGLTTVLVRTANGNCCEFCNNLEGIYEYDGTPECGTGENVFARHTGCTCTIDVRTERAKSFERVNNYRRQKK